MNKIYQTTFGHEKGNCHQACMATYFNLSLDDVPNFVIDHRSDWWNFMNKWTAKQFDIRFLYLDMTMKDKTYLLKEIGLPTIWTVKKPDRVNHCVIGEGLEVIHDPNKTGPDVNYEMLIAIQLPLKTFPWLGEL